MNEPNENKGRDKLWLWFGLSRASFLTLPRVLMHDMPDEWQDKMADLLNEYDETFTKRPDVQSYVNLRQDGKFIRVPDWMRNYRHPRRSEIDNLKR
jgi:hypothetical protein